MNEKLYMYQNRNKHSVREFFNMCKTVKGLTISHDGADVTTSDRTSTTVAQIDTVASLSAIHATEIQSAHNIKRHC